MEILILGDSWAVELPNMRSEKHTASLLREQGHTIHNCGIAGGSNLRSLQQAKIYLGYKKIKIDWAVWFHTELSRDKERCDFKKMSIQEFMDQMSHLVYAHYKQFFQDLGCKVAVIGGCADIYHNFFDYIQPNFCIPSWRQEIIGVNGLCMSTTEWVPHTKDTTANKLHWINMHTEAMLAMDASPDFPDCAHPGTRPHQDLARRLLELF